MASQRDDDDIEAWVRKLSGKDGAPDAETRALRRAIEVHVQRQSSPPDAGSDDAAWQQLRFRLRRERLVTGGKPAWRTWIPAAAVAALVAVLGLPMLLPTPDPDVAVNYGAPPVLRGAEGPQEIAVADPLKSARRAAVIAGKQEGRPLVWFHEGRATVDFEMDPAAVAPTQKDMQREWPEAKVQPGLNRFVFRVRP